MKRLFSSFSSSFFFILAGCALLASGCAQKKELSVPEDVPMTPSAHRWFYFSDGNFEEIDKPKNAPYLPAKPWTEATRISAASCAAASGMEPAPKAYAVVNRRGILVFDGAEATLHNDAELFAGRTAGNIVFYGATPIFSLYRSTFFNDKNSTTRQLHPFLVQFQPEQNVSYPVISIENLNLGENAEVTDFIWDGQFWTCSVKTDGRDAISFSYLTFQEKESLTTLTPATASSKIFITEAQQEAFRNAQMPRPFSQAPRRLQELCASLPESVEFSVKCHTAGGHSPRSFIRESGDKKIRGGDGGSSILKANALIADTWMCAVFQDGTVFFNGALHGRRILNKGKTLALRLPKLPAGFLYSDFAVSDATLYAAWEETSFFKTGRSGFIAVNLDELLYNNSSL